MKYIKVKWFHEDEEFPVLLFSELNDERLETRKIDVFANGTCGYDDGSEPCGELTLLGYEAVPELEELSENSEFEPYEISRDEFELAWENRVVPGTFFKSLLNE